VLIDSDAELQASPEFKGIKAPVARAFIRE